MVIKSIFFHIKKRQPWLVRLIWFEHHPVHQKVLHSIPSQDTHLSCGFKPQLGCIQEVTDGCSLVCVLKSLGIFQKFQSPGLISEQLNLSPRKWGTVCTEAPQDASVLGILAGMFVNPKLCRNTIHKYNQPLRYLSLHHSVSVNNSCLFKNLNVRCITPISTPSQFQSACCP